MTIAKLLGVLLLCAFFVSGCATGPRYSYSQQPDSANVEGFSRMQGPEDGNCVIAIVRVDGTIANFDASLPGYIWPAHQERLFLSPGMHTLSLDISQIRSEDVSSGSSAERIKGVSSVSNKPTVTTVFEAKHIYRFSANWAGGNSSFIYLTLWDETSGPGSRSEVQSWRLDSNYEYSEEDIPD